jgi:hypothetical protein
LYNFFLHQLPNSHGLLTIHASAYNTIIIKFTAVPINI